MDILDLEGDTVVAVEDERFDGVVVLRFGRGAVMYLYEAFVGKPGLEGDEPYVKHSGVSPCDECGQPALGRRCPKCALHGDE